MGRILVAFTCVYGVATGAMGDDGRTPASTPKKGQGVTDPQKPAVAGIEEIVITARKREENLQDTPISVTAFSGDDVEDLGLVRGDDIGNLVPNLQFHSSSVSQNSARLQIRGVGNSDPIPTRDPGVGIYMNGIYLAREQGGLLGLVDVERIEVLRGPQGTLFGRNTIGGALNIIPRKPSDEFEAQGTFRAGNFDLFESRATVNLPLVPERLATRISLQTRTRDGYSKNRMTGKDTDDRRLLGGRIALRANLSDNLEWLFNGEQTRSHVAGRGGECRLNPALVNSFPVPTFENAIFGLGASCQASQGGDELSYSSPINSKDNLDTVGLDSTFTYAGSSVTFKSLSAWRRQENARNEDFTFASVNVGNVLARKEQQDQVSQEFNLGGTAFDDRLAWTTGLFGLYEKTTPGQATTLVAFNLCQIGGGLAGFCTASFTQSSSIGTLALAAYGQGTFDVTEKLHVTAGLRRSVEGKHYKQSQQSFTSATTLGATFATNQTDRFDKWTPMLNVSYDLSDDSIVYATFSRGFKSGGFNGRPSPALANTLEPFKQEVLDSYEIGLKSSWFDQHLIGNLALFNGNYDDIQITVLSVDTGTGAFASRVSNAGKAVIRGAEIELRALPTPALDLRVGLGFTDADYKDYSDTNLAGMTVDNSDFDFFNVPNFTGSVSAAYTLSDLFGMGDVTTRLSWFHQNKVNYGPGTDSLKQGAFGLLSGQLSWALPDGKTAITLFAENLLDRRYMNGGIGFEQGFADSIAFYGPPRMYGIEIRRTFR